MGQRPIDNQFFLDLRREFDEFRSEMRAALKQIDEDTDMLGDHSMYVKGLGIKFSKYMDDHIKHIYNDVDTIYDMIGPFDQKIFPQVNSVRGILESIREELTKIKNNGRPEDKADDQPKG